MKEFIIPKFDDIKKKYKDISLDDAINISSYTYELDGEDSAYNIYKILNTNMASYNRKQGISNVSKYIFLLLNSLRKLDKYYPEKNDKFLYRCITVLVKLDYDSFNPKYVPYLRGKQKTFWGFTSSTPKITTAYSFLGKNKSGTIFTLTGKVWGYDITLFNICGEEEILLEPERKFNIKESLPEYNGIIYVRCSIEDTPIVLGNLSQTNTYRSMDPNFLINLFEPASPIEQEYKYGIKTNMVNKNPVYYEKQYSKKQEIDNLYRNVYIYVCNIQKIFEGNILRLLWHIYKIKFFHFFKFISNKIFFLLTLI